MCVVCVVVLCVDVEGVAVGQGDEWTLTATAEVFGQDSWVSYVGPWGDGFIVVGEPNFHADFGSDNVTYEAPPSRVVLLTR